jgi:phage tail sheath protein FI
VREARRIGTDAVFEPSGEATWAQVRGQMEALLRALYRIGALNGNSERDAFEVRCDRTTMTQNDIDNGRLICTVSVAPAAAIEQIRVVLSFNQNGLVSLLPAAA